jgi:ubiquitin-protein ligase E3 B
MYLLPCRYGLFVQTATEEGLLFPHAAAGSLGHGLQMLEFLGRVVGKALYEGILLEYSFSPLFVSKLLGRYSFLDELSSLDAELHRNLVYLKVCGYGLLFIFILILAAIVAHVSDEVCIR